MRKHSSEGEQTVFRWQKKPMKNDGIFDIIIWVSLVPSFLHIVWDKGWHLKTTEVSWHIFRIFYFLASNHLNCSMINYFIFCFNIHQNIYSNAFHYHEKIINKFLIFLTSLSTLSFLFMSRFSLLLLNSLSIHELNFSFELIHF